MRLEDYKRGYECYTTKTNAWSQNARCLLSSVTRKCLELNTGLFSTAQTYILPAYYALRRIKGHYKLS